MPAGSQAQGRIERDMLALGIFLDGTDDQGGARVPRWSCKCSQCLETTTALVRVGRPIEAIKQRFHGWLLGKKPRCPNCIGRDRTVANGQVKNLLIIIAKLEEVWDEPGGKYKPGWSDARVAEVTAMSVKLVEEIRAERCGPVGDPEIERLEGDIASLRTLIDDIAGRVEALRTRRKLAG